MVRLLLLAACCSAATDVERWEDRWSSGAWDDGWRAQVGPVDVTCEFRYRLGIRDGKVGGTRPALAVAYGRPAPYGPSRQRIVFEPDAAAADDFASTPRLCEYRSSKTINGSAPADLMVASSVGYLFRLWPYFVNHVCYGEAAGHRVFVWIGELPEGLATTVNGGCRGSRQGQLLLAEGMLPDQRRLKSAYYGRGDGYEALNSNHYNKIREPRLADAIHGAGTLDLSFSNAGSAAPLNGCAFWRRSPSRAPSSTAGSRRCGFGPVPALARSPRRRTGCLSYDGEIYGMLSHDAMKRGAELHPHLALSAAQLRVACASFRFAPTRFEWPAHRSVPGDALARFPYEGGEFNVSNLLEGTPDAGRLLAFLGLGDLDPDTFL
ncbi:10-hydroxy-9-(phosphonooxy)octadecanoate phosphatase [Aureococcus anophagefferens]|nr:10-hydroxy-9-(phosphonooxy)octadecanoate phosphatase [Aureococcus anophagefferens]